MSSAQPGAMGGSSTTLTLTALLCLGLCRSSWDLVQAGVLPKPTIWAETGHMVALGSPVTIWCQGSLQADVYHLHKERVSGPWATRTLEESSNRTSFPTESASFSTAGRYQCAYHSSREGWSERSDLLPLVVMGLYRAPSLSAHPSPVVALERNVSLLCSSEFTYGTFHLLKEGGADPPQHMESEWLRDLGRWQALFPMGPASTSHGGTYRCYGSQNSYVYGWSQPSDPLRLEVTGVYREPSLSAQPGTLVLSGVRLSLQCHSEASFDRFALTKDEGLTPPQHLDGQRNPDFPLGPMTRSLGGQYRCYSGHNRSYAWSAPSAPLDILITGMYKKPFLSAQPGLSVPWGGKVTLQCHSETLSDTFYLHKEGSSAPPQHFRLQDTAASFQANFTMNPVTSAHGGTYRCYSSWSTSPYLLSHPSDPIEFVVSGLKRYLNILIGVLVALVLLFSLLLFLLLQHWRQGKCRISVAASEPEDRGLQKSSSPAADVQEHLYAAVKATPDDTQLDSQTVASEDPQDMTYAQINHRTLRRKTSALPSSPDPLDEPSMYAALAISSPGQRPQTAHS